MSRTTTKTTRDGRAVTTGIIRYLRPFAEFLDRQSLDGTFRRLTTVVSKDNLGGVTFAFEIDHDAGELHVGYAICSENFNKEVGRETALAALSSPDRLTLKHDKSCSLVEQTVHAVLNGQLSETPRLKTLARHLREMNLNPTLASDRYQKALDRWVNKPRNNLRSDDGC